MQITHLIRQKLTQAIEEKGMDKDDVKYELLQYGSSFFGADTTDSDYDLVLVMTLQGLKLMGLDQFNGRNSFFFETFSNLLAEEPISDLQVFLIPSAKVPIIKMKYKNLLSVDLSFVLIANQEIDTNQIHKFICDDSQSLTCINAIQICQQLQSIVNHCGISNERFSIYLKYIKLWAQSRNIYGQQFCFLGGIAWSILVANICVLYPHSLTNIQDTQDVLVPFLIKFFKFYSKWEWPNPIIIDTGMFEKENLNGLSNEYGKVGGQQSWNPISSSQDSNHFMPILTPGKIQQNVGEQVTMSHLTIYQTEFLRSYKIIKKVFKGKSQLSSIIEEKKKSLGEQRKQFDFVLEIEVISKGEQGEELQKSEQWDYFKYQHEKFQLGLESKLRSLLNSLQLDLNQNSEDDCIIRYLSYPSYSSSKFEGSTILLVNNLSIGIKLISKQDIGVVGIQSAISDFVQKVEQIRDQLKQNSIKAYCPHLMKLKERSEHLIKLKIEKQQNRQ